MAYTDPGAVERREGIAPNGKVYESVWDYPRPPALERVEWRIVVEHGGETIADAPCAMRVLETSQPPAYYIDPAFVDERFLRPSTNTTFCEWKGSATYASVVVDGDRAADAAWTYRSPTSRFEPISDFWAFYAQKLDRCLVDGEVVVANPGAFYGGWMTANITGPVKGGPGTGWW